MPLRTKLVKKKQNKNNLYRFICYMNHIFNRESIVVELKKINKTAVNI